MSPRLAGWQLSRYRLPLRRPWSFGTHRLAARSGWLLRVEDEDGLMGWGEAAPLPEAGTEDLATAGAWLEQTAAALQGRALDQCLGALPPAARAPPAARCGLESALLDLAARRAGLPLAQWLAPGAADTVAVNAALGQLEGLAEADLEHALAQGFRCLKLKLGGGEPTTQAVRVRDLCRRLPEGVRLRLDANRAWAPEAARTFLATLEAPQVELVEEPLADPEPKALAALRATSPVPLALDESLTHAGLDALLEQPPTDLLVLKPMRLGGVLACLDIARRARDAGLGVVVTGMLDGTPATLAAAHLAAALDATGTPATHGLATAGWLARDLAPPPPVAAGRLRLPDTPGLGCPCDGGGLA